MGEKMKKLSKFVIAAALAVVPSVSSAAVVSFVVDSKIHSSNTMNGLATGIFLEEGEEFSVSADGADTWFLGGMTTEYTNADGFGDFPAFTQENLTALYGSLAGRISEGGFFVIGTDYTGTAANAGELFLYNWDSGNSENLDEIMVTVTTIDKVAEASVGVVPIPASGTLMLAALVGFGMLRRFG